MAKITLKEYSIRHEKDLGLLRKKAQRGTFQTAEKIGRDWFIDEDEPLLDARITSGKYIDYRYGYQYRKRLNERKQELERERELEQEATEQADVEQADVEQETTSQPEEDASQQAE